jgi:arginase
VKPVHLIGVPLDLGAGRRGVDMGPSAFRIAGIRDQIVALGRSAADKGDLPTPIPETQRPADENKKYVRDIAKVCQKLYERTLKSLDEGALPLVLGGDHSLAAGSVAASADWIRRTSGKPLGLVWVDAHGDMNTPATTESGNVHGMPLAAALGRAPETFASEAWPLPALDPQHVALLGIRSLDAGERQLVKELGIAVYTMTDLDRRGVEPVVREALECVSGAPFVHVSLDMDVVDPEAAPGVGTPVRGGFSYREAHLAMELVAEWGEFSSFEVVEVNPILDRENATGELAVELAASAFGATIL